MRIIRQPIAGGGVTRWLLAGVGRLHSGCNHENRRAAVSLEFAILAVPLLIMSLGLMELSYDLYVQAVLDNAVETAARGVQVGTNTGTNKESSIDFVTQAVCPALRGRLACNQTQLIVGVAPLPVQADGTQFDYFTAPPIVPQAGPGHFSLPLGSSTSKSGAASPDGEICTGSASQLMMLQAWYISPSFVGLLIPSFTQVNPVSGIGWVHVTASRAGFVNEVGIPGQPVGVGCS